MIDIRAMELLCSRLCHDLISPVSAIRNGMEILEESEEDGSEGFRGEAQQLINHAAQQAEGRLRLFRLAYGQAGREVNGFGDARQAAISWFTSGRTKLNWPAAALPDPVARRRGLVKVLLNVLVLADESLTHGGTITVGSAGTPAAGEIIITVEGRPGHLTEELAAALNGGVAADDLSPRAVHAYITGVFIRAYGLAFAMETGEVNEMTIRLGWQ